MPASFRLRFPRCFAPLRAAGLLLVLAAAPLFAQPSDLKVTRLTPDGQSFSDLDFESNAAPTVSDDGRWVILWFDGEVDNVIDLHIASRFGGDVRRVSVPRPPGSFDNDQVQARFTPDSRFVVFNIDQETTGRPELWSVPVDGDVTDALKLSGFLPSNAIVNGFQLSADGQRAVFTASSGGGVAHSLWSVRVDGTGAPTRLNPGAADSPDPISTRIFLNQMAFIYSDGSGPRQLWRAPADGSAAAARVSGDLIPSGNVDSFDFTPDGTRLMYRADARFDEVYELWSVPVAGSPASAVRLSPDLPAFGDVSNWQVNSAAGRALYQVDSSVDGQLELWSSPLVGPASAAVHLNGALVTNGDVNVVFSEGNWVSYIADNAIDDVFQAYVVPIDGPFTAAVRLHDPLPAGRSALLAALLPPSGGGDPDPLALLAGDLRANDKLELFVQTLDAADDPYPLFGDLPDGSGYLPSCGSGGPPDLSSIVLCADLGTSGHSAVYRLDLEIGSTPDRLSHGLVIDGGNATRTKMSPDGRWALILGDLTVDDRFELYRARVDGTGAPQRVHAVPAFESRDVEPGVMEYTPDSRGILYIADHENNGQLDLWISDSMIFGAGFETASTSEWSAP